MVNKVIETAFSIKSNDTKDKIYNLHKKLIKKYSENKIKMKNEAKGNYFCLHNK